MPEFIIFANDLRLVSQAGFGRPEGPAFPEFENASSHLNVVHSRNISFTGAPLHSIGCLTQLGGKHVHESSVGDSLPLSCQ